jgi:hypothetical protein
MRVAERSDRIEPLLVGHDKQDVRPAQWHFVSTRFKRNTASLAVRSSGYPARTELQAGKPAGRIRQDA